MNLHDLVADPKKLTTYNTHISPEVAYKRLKKGDKSPGLVAILARDPEWAYWYAHDVLKGPFPAGEKAIAKNCLWAYFYAKEVLKKPFLVGEKTLASEPYWAYRYAADVLKGPFPAGEEIIARHPRWLKIYQDFLKKQKDNKFSILLSKFLKLWNHQ